MRYMSRKSMSPSTDFSRLGSTVVEFFSVMLNLLIFSTWKSASNCAVQSGGKLCLAIHGALHVTMCYLPVFPKTPSFGTPLRACRVQITTPWCVPWGASSLGAARIRLIKSRWRRHSAGLVRGTEWGIETSDKLLQFKVQGMSKSLSLTKALTTEIVHASSPLLSIIFRASI